MDKIVQIASLDIVRALYHWFPLLSCVYWLFYNS